MHQKSRPSPRSNLDPRPTSLKLKFWNMVINSKLKANVVCGHFCFDGGPDHPFLNSLPNVVHIKSTENSHSPWLTMLLSIIEQEAKSGLPGSNTLVRKLTEIIFVQALRIHMYKSNKNVGFFKLIENPQLSKSLEADPS